MRYSSEQKRFLQAIAQRIPALLKCIESGNWQCGYLLGKKRLSNGTLVNLRLEATDAAKERLPILNKDETEKEIQ